MKKQMQAPVLVTRNFRNTNIITTSGDGIQLHNEQINMDQKTAVQQHVGQDIPAYGIQW